MDVDKVGTVSDRGVIKTGKRRVWVQVQVTVSIMELTYGRKFEDRDQMLVKVEYIKYKTIHPSIGQL